MKFHLIIVLIFIETITHAAYDPCKYLKIKSCGNNLSINKSTGASQPSSSRSFSMPSATAAIKGYGIESIWFDGVDMSIVAGNGHVGGGVSSANSDDTFFGNIAKETAQDYEDRLSSAGGKKYKVDKYTFATAFSAIGNAKSNFTLNIGAIAKYVVNSENYHFGASASAVLGPLSLGYAQYKDEGETDSLTDDEAESITYNVTSYSLGLNLPLISFDYTIFDNDTEQVNYVEVYSAAIFYSSWMISYGRRMEESFRGQYDYINGEFNYPFRKWSTFLGLQYRTKNKWVIGGLYNYYLNNEVSFILTGFF